MSSRSDAHERPYSTLVDSGVRQIVAITERVSIDLERGCLNEAKVALCAAARAYHELEEQLRQHVILDPTERDFLALRLARVQRLISQSERRLAAYTEEDV
jgi:hypothetical protein